MITRHLRGRSIAYFGCGQTSHSANSDSNLPLLGQTTDGNELQVTKFNLFNLTVVDFQISVGTNTKDENSTMEVRVDEATLAGSVITVGAGLLGNFRLTNLSISIVAESECSFLKDTSLSTLGNFGYSTLLTVVTA